MNRFIPYYMIVLKYVIIALFLSGALYFWGYYSIPYAYQYATGVALTQQQTQAINDIFFNTRTPSFILLLLFVDAIIHNLFFKLYDKWKGDK